VTCWTRSAVLVFETTMSSTRRVTNSCTRSGTRAKLPSANCSSIDAREGDGEPQTDPGSADKQQTDREIGHPECGGCDDVGVM
jgi:hypothetical protein